MRVVGISGAQGGGKSSLLNELKGRGYEVDEFRVSRAVQAQLGWASLDRVMSSFETMTTFQEEVFKQKYENDLALAKIPSHGMILTERTFMDVYAYAQSWTWKFVDEGIDFEVGSRWLSAYSRKCMSAQMECYAGTILLPLMDHVVFENDPHRAKKEDAARVYEEVASVAQRLKFSGHQSFVLSAKSIHDRADQVEGYLKLVKKND